MIPLGEAVLALYGAVDEMAEVVESQSFIYLGEAQDKLRCAIVDYKEARENADPFSIVDRKWLKEGDELLEQLQVKGNG